MSDSLENRLISEIDELHQIFPAQIFQCDAKVRVVCDGSELWSRTIQICSSESAECVYKMCFGWTPEADCDLVFGNRFLMPTDGAADRPANRLHGPKNQSSLRRLSDFWSPSALPLRAQPAPKCQGYALLLFYSTFPPRDPFSMCPSA
jgi:hypothetical protein